MTVHVIIGTKAQWIKMAPVLAELKSRGMPVRLIDTGQHAELSRRLRKSFGVEEPQVFVGTGISAKGISSGLGWLARLAGRMLSFRDEIASRIFGNLPGLVLVHGDNLTTAFGAALALRAGLPLAIVEAGLRSFHPLHPFPEELLRMALPRLADILFAPSGKAVENLARMRVRGRVIYTFGNTIADALRTVLPKNISAGDYGLWNFHRLETLLLRGRLEKLCRLLLQARKFGPIKFILDLPTRPRLERWGWLRRLEEAGVELCPLLDYPDFVKLMAAARYVASDGGSIQEECALLGTPCLVLRRKTERLDGVGRNVVLLGHTEPGDFFAAPQRYRFAPCWPPRSPAQTIAAVLQERLS